MSLRRCMLALVACGEWLLAGAADAAESEANCRPAPGQVVVFDQPGFRGECVVLGNGEYRMPQDIGLKARDAWADSAGARQFRLPRSLRFGPRAAGRRDVEVVACRLGVFGNVDCRTLQRDEAALQEVTYLRIAEQFTDPCAKPAKGRVVLAPSGLSHFCIELSEGRYAAPADMGLLDDRDAVGRQALARQRAAIIAGAAPLTFPISGLREIRSAAGSEVITCRLPEFRDCQRRGGSALVAPGEVAALIVRRFGSVDDCRPRFGQAAVYASTAPLGQCVVLGSGRHEGAQALAPVGPHARLVAPGADTQVNVCVRQEAGEVACRLVVEPTVVDDDTLSSLEIVRMRRPAEASASGD